MNSALLKRFHKDHHHQKLQEHFQDMVRFSVDSVPFAPSTPLMFYPLRTPTEIGAYRTLSCQVKSKLPVIHLDPDLTNLKFRVSDYHCPSLRKVMSQADSRIIDPGRLEKDIQQSIRHHERAAWQRKVEPTEMKYHFEVDDLIPATQHVRERRHADEEERPVMDVVEESFARSSLFDDSVHKSTAAHPRHPSARVTYSTELLPYYVPAGQSHVRTYPKEDKLQMVSFLDGEPSAKRNSHVGSVFQRQRADYNLLQPAIDMRDPANVQAVKESIVVSDTPMSSSNIQYDVVGGYSFEYKWARKRSYVVLVVEESEDGHTTDVHVAGTLLGRAKRARIEDYNPNVVVQFIDPPPRVEKAEETEVVLEPPTQASQAEVSEEPSQTGPRTHVSQTEGDEPSQTVPPTQVSQTEGDEASQTVPPTQVSQTEDEPAGSLSLTEAPATNEPMPVDESEDENDFNFTL